MASKAERRAAVQATHGIWAHLSPKDLAELMQTNRHDPEQAPVEAPAVTEEHLKDLKAAVLAEVRALLPAHSQQLTAQLPFCAPIKFIGHNGALGYASMRPGWCAPGDVAMLPLEALTQLRGVLVRWHRDEALLVQLQAEAAAALRVEDG